MTKAEIKSRLDVISKQKASEMGDKLKKALEAKLEILEGKQVNK